MSLDKKIGEIILSSSEYPHEGLTEDENKVKEKIMKAIYDLTETIIGKDDELLGESLDDGGNRFNRNQLRAEMRKLRDEVLQV